jgi:hypothetical protein
MQCHASFQLSESVFFYVCEDLAITEMIRQVGICFSSVKLAGCLVLLLAELLVTAYARRALPSHGRVNAHACS